MKIKKPLLDALQGVVSYQGLASELQSWKDIEPSKYGFLSPTYWDKWKNEDAEVCAQLQVFWMICVLLFGEYGTSPRFGWIEDIESFKTFIDLVTRCRGKGNDDVFITKGNGYCALQTEEEYEQLLQHVGYTDEQLGRNK